MFCAQFANPYSYYGNIQCGFYNPQPYKWGAWELPYPRHYQSPLTESEERVIEEHRGNTPQLVQLPVRIDQENHEAIILRMQHEIRMKSMHEQPLQRHVVSYKKPESGNDDDEDFFIIM